MGVEARVGELPGDPFEVLFNPEAAPGEQGSEGSAVLSVVPREMISFSWNAPPKFAFARTQKTWVVVTLEAMPATGTLVRLRHFGFAELAGRHPEHRREIEDVRAYFANAWPQVLKALAAKVGPE